MAQPQGRMQGSTGQWLTKCPIHPTQNLRQSEEGVVICYVCETNARKTEIQELDLSSYHPYKPGALNPGTYFVGGDDGST